MSCIDEMIAQLASEGVRHVALSKMAEYSQTRVEAVDLDETNFVGVDNLVADKGGRVDASYPPNTVRLTAYEPGDILLGNIRPYLKKVWRATNAGGCSGDVLAVRVDVEHRDRLDSEFLYYLLSSDDFFAYNMQHAKGAKMPRGNKTAIMDYRIPVPPLEMQREIVRVLDNFTQLEAELEAELEARRAQYEHYRDELVGANGRRRIRLADLGTFVRGRRFTKNDVVESGIPSLHYGEIYTAYGTSATQALRNVRAELRDQLRYAQPGSVVFAGVGETVADVGKAVAWLGEEPIATHDDTFTFSSELNPKYVAYAVQTADFHQQKERHVSRAKVKRLSAMGLGAIEIPVPSLEEQESIVRSLDKFDALVGDISTGLPAELAARRKQYEHYRDRLLTFKELAS